MMSIPWMLLYGLAVVLCFAPLPYGSVQPDAASALSASCLGLGVVWIVARARRGLPPLPWNEPVLIGGALILLLGVLQMVPLPQAVLQEISPRSAQLRDLYEPALSAGAWRPISLDPWATRQTTLRIAACLAAVLMTMDLAILKGARRALAIALVAGGSFQAIYGLTEYFSGHQHIFGYAKQYYTTVATGTFINRNHFAGYLEMTIPFVIAMAAMLISRLVSSGGPNLGQRLANAPGRLLFVSGLLLVLALIMTTALVCSRSRMGIVSALLALLTVGLFMAWRGRGRSFGIAAVGVIGITFILFSQGNAGTPIADRFAAITGELESGLGRWSIWQQGLAVAWSFPVLGAGLGAFPAVFPMFRTSGEGIGLDHAHNDFLEFAAETGLLGCAAVLLAGALVLRMTLRRPAGPSGFDLYGYAGAAGLVAILFHSVTDCNLAIPSNALTLAVLFGMTLGRCRAPALVLAADQRIRRPWIAKTLVPAGLVAALIPVAMAPALRSDDGEWLFRKADALSGAALADMTTLVRAQSAGIVASPVSMDYVRDRLDEASRLQEAGLRQAPLSSTGHLGLAQIRIGRCGADALAGREDRGCMSLALPELRAALRLNPVSAAIHAQAARVLIAGWALLDDGDQEEAREIIDRALALNRGDRELRRQAVSIETKQRTGS